MQQQLQHCARGMLGERGVPLLARAGRDAVNWRQFEGNCLIDSEQTSPELGPLFYHAYTGHKVHHKIALPNNYLHGRE